MTIQQIAKQLVAKGKGILAADESNPSAGKSLAKYAELENTEENRRNMREMLLTTADMEKYISGVILYDETIRQTTSDGVNFAELLENKGVITGIKVDMGLEAITENSDEMVTKGLDGLDKRLEEYYKIGARFAKWRAVYSVYSNTDNNKNSLPSDECIAENAKRLAAYAKKCQQANIVPIVEPEVLLGGKYDTHNIEECYEATLKVQKALFAELKAQDVDLEGLLLKASMVIQGANCPEKNSPEEVAQQTLQCLSNAVPMAVAGVVFLSGGQSDDEAINHLNLMNKITNNTNTNGSDGENDKNGEKNQANLPWPLTFSYLRALQSSALMAWKGQNIQAGQGAFIKNAKACSLASTGEY